MKTRSNLAFALLACAMVITVAAAAQQPVKTAKQMEGTWMLVSNLHVQGEKKTDFFGPNPRGLMMMGREGHFVRVVTRSDVPKFASNNRQTGTLAENKAVVQGSIAYFGRYSCDSADGICNLHVEGSTFPNWVGDDQKRLFTLAGDELRETVPNPASGAGQALIVWKRVK